MTYGKEKPLTRAVSSEKLLNCDLHEHLLKSQTKTSLLRDSIRPRRNTHRRTQSYTFDINYLTKSKLNVNINVTQQQQQIRTGTTKQRVGSYKKLEEPPLLQAFFTYLSYTILRWFGNLRDFLRVTGVEKRKGAKDNNTSVT